MKPAEPDNPWDACFLNYVKLICARAFSLLVIMCLLVGSSAFDRLKRRVFQITCYVLSKAVPDSGFVIIIITSTPVVRTGVIPTCRSLSPPVVVSLSHGPRDCPASLSHLANDRPMHYRFFTFWPGGLTPGPKFTKREMTWWTPPRSTTLQNFIALRQPTPEIPVTKNPADKQTKKQTVNDISPNMPIGMWG